MRILPTLIITGALAASITGCKKRSETPPPPPATAPPSIQIEANKAPVIKLLDPGQEPRERLRYKLGSTWSGKMLMDMDMDLETQGQRVDNPTSSFVMAVRSEPAAGGLRVSCVFEDVSVSGGTEATRQASGDMLKSMKGISMHMTMSDRGYLSDMDIRYPEGAPDTLKQSMDSMRNSVGNLTAPLPEEAIGKGARWEVMTALTSNGMAMEQTATMELLEKSGDTIKLKVQLKQTGAPQTIKLPVGEAKLLRLAGAMDGQSEISLARPFPLTHIKGSSEIELESGGQKVAMKFYVEMAMKDSSVPGTKL